MKIRAGDVLNGKYEIERHLAKGGMGSIWIARDLKLCRRVAVKFIELAPKDAADASAIHARFEREALAVARLNTPHVVQVFDHALDADPPYLVMEYLEGEDLKHRFDREDRLPFPAVVSMMNQAARGLRAAHEAGIVHRDLKPANIFLADVDHEKVVKILDFGIAKMLDHRAVTVDGEIFGSARYMSPEQIVGAKDLDLRSDLWSMGIILYRAITGCDAYCGDIVETMAALRLGVFPPATTVAPDLLPEVDTFFERALAFDKKRRFLSAVEMAEAFAEVMDRQAAATTEKSGASTTRGVSTIRPGAALPSPILPGAPLPSTILPGAPLPSPILPGAALPSPILPGAALPSTSGRRRAAGDHVVTSTVVQMVPPTQAEREATARLGAAPVAPPLVLEPPAAVAAHAPEVPILVIEDTTTHPDNTVRPLSTVRDEETFSATSRETRTGGRARSRLGFAVAALVASAIATFALWPSAAPVASYARAPAAADRVIAPAASTPIAPPEPAKTSAAAPSAPQPVAAASEAPVVAPEPESAPAPQSSPPSPHPSSASPVRRAAAPATSARAPAGHSTTKPRAAGKPSCDPPFTVDANGDKHAIRECLFQ